MKEEGDVPHIELASTAPETMKKVRSWATIARDKVKSDSQSLASALLNIFGPRHSRTTRSKFCSSSSMCPEEDDEIGDGDTTVIMGGHSLGGAAAKLQGVILTKTGEVKV